MTKTRESQFELLRIIAMAMVLTVHFNGIVIEQFLPLTDCNFSDIWGVELVEAMAIVGVNIFALISGYFGIRVTTKSIAKYVGWCLWYAVIIYGIDCLFHPQHFTPENSQHAINCFTHTTQWFVRSYFMLMVLSPVINTILAKSSFRAHLWISGALIAANCIGGWWFDMAFNATGYTTYHLIFIYILGHTIHEVLARYKHLPWRAIAVAAYIISIPAVLFTMQTMEFTKATAYNNPAIVIESLAIFIFFATLRLQSKTINWVASSAFAVYLIHMHFSIWGNTIKPYLSDIYTTYGSVGFYLLAPIAAGIVFTTCIWLDQPRARVFNWIFSSRIWQNDKQP